ncbi:hypothetical protein FisN_10Lh120 [Fistulifera solaris]|uniref:J domain-containing protein n=1 Tax=Fistulifera solaris TaxID=1519565 RepID=A0A1Z5JTS3_FISSO|nr:hypothetical protein FisN_10Lh120 [Fistulifera solaris]|eukprot:GAX17262.1 hypothetical protein FisN_10Lh120 [Fistulifera solaris]
MRRSLIQTSNRTQQANNNPALLDLQAVDDAFGPNADLYKDCLRVSNHATCREIHDAFFVKRRELLHKLEQGQDCQKQIDAVVLAVRILGDVERRAQYDDLRVERMQRNASEPHALPHSRHQHVPRNHEMPYPLITETNSDAERLNTDDDISSAPPQRRTRIVTPEPKVDDATTVYTYDDTVTMDPTIMDDMTLLSSDTHLPRTFLDRLTLECMGAFEDTSKSLEEVFGVFTLQDDEIDAVVKRINKAKRQMYMEF